LLALKLLAQVCIVFCPESLVGTVLGDAY